MTPRLESLATILTGAVAFEATNEASASEVTAAALMMSQNSATRNESATASATSRLIATLTHQVRRYFCFTECAHSLHRGISSSTAALTQNLCPNPALPVCRQLQQLIGRVSLPIRNATESLVTHAPKSSNFAALSSPPGWSLSRAGGVPDGNLGGNGKFRFG